MSGREATFLLGRLECTADRLRLGSLCVDLEKIRGAAERVARSEGLQIVEVEWKVGRQRVLRVYIARIPKPAAVSSGAAWVELTSEVGHSTFREMSGPQRRTVREQ